MPEWRTPMHEIKVGTGRKIADGEEVAILTFGHVGNMAVEACAHLAKRNIKPAHYDLRFVKPLDEALLHEIFGEFSRIITVEDGCIQGGFGSAILEFMSDNGYHADVRRLGIPDRIIEHGEQPQLYEECNYDAPAIERSVISLLETVSKIP
jgi:1-deoxy-D-xylulose-5-phosphate synthase